MKQKLIETLEWVQKSLNESKDPDLIIAEVANAIAEAKEADEKKSLEVKRWLRTGELSEHLKSQSEIIEECGRALDKACAYEIVGEAVFEATNGKYYVITTEALIDECNPEYVKDLLKEIEEEDEQAD